MPSYVRVSPRQTLTRDLPRETQVTLLQTLGNRNGIAI